MLDIAQGKSSGSRLSQIYFGVFFLQIIYFGAQKLEVLLNKPREYHCMGALMNLRAPP